MKAAGYVKDLAVAFAITYAWPFVANLIIFMTSDEYLYVSGQEAFHGRNFVYFVCNSIMIPTIAVIQYAIVNYSSIKKRILICITVSIMSFYTITGPFKIGHYTPYEWIYSQISFWFFVVLQS